MVRVRLEHDVDEERHERVRALVALANMPNQPCSSNSVSYLSSERLSCPANAPKMTLHAFRTQMSLSLGALYWLILHSSRFAKSRKPVVCLYVLASRSSSARVEGSFGEPAFSSHGELGVGGVSVGGGGACSCRSRCCGSSQANSRIRWLRTRSRSRSSVGGMRPGGELRSTAGEKVLWDLQFSKFNKR